ncbi:hypothetical protein N7537_005118 [Penicillium hordei]|uniref:Uncharacterized protein n=1 Tax=Penicillium hordei TaxID=40994 RepID=A0AAD6ECS1_9EURO|nr:uncharacterized protein N7537_005118 [Penicillium hordei]KAJ5608499.1 hypothetical protein N7537_005118 [Penicillium hordei]
MGAFCKPTLITSSVTPAGCLSQQWKSPGHVAIYSDAAVSSSRLSVKRREFADLKPIFLGIWDFLDTMKYNRLFMPNGQRIDVRPSFEGFKFTVADHNLYGSFPPEWRIILCTEAAAEGKASLADNQPSPCSQSSSQFTAPTLQTDVLHLSSISMPSAGDVKPESAITRQVAMILWATFLWYFQEHAPSPHVPVYGENELPELARATGEWVLKLSNDGILQGKDRMQKLERMGLLATADPSVGSQDDPQAFSDMFISQRAFWQLDPRIYLFTLSPAQGSAKVKCSDTLSSLDSFGVGFPFGAGPHTSGTFMPSYYPPIPPQYTFTDHVRHPIRPRAPRQGEVFYTRYVPSGGEYLTFRVPVVPIKGSLRAPSTTELPSSWTGPNLCLDSELMSDLKLFHRWVNQYSTHTSLLRKGSLDVQLEDLKIRMSSKSSFPALACWDSMAVGYFEIFWILEDHLGLSVGDVGDWDRGTRFFIGDDDFNDPKTLALFLSSVVHYCWLSDQRTYAVFVEVRADNERFVS